MSDYLDQKQLEKIYTAPLQTTIKEYLISKLKEYQAVYGLDFGIDIDLNKFVSDFIGIRVLNKSHVHYPFYITLDQIIEWLQIKADRHFPDIFKDYKDENGKIIKSDYIKGIDYIEEIQPSTGGRPKTIYYVTLNCFRMICFRTHSSRSKELYRIYMTMEDLVFEYQNKLIEGLIHDGKLKAEDLNPYKKLPEGGLIYVLELGEHTYKLGMTKDINARMRIYNTGFLHKAKVVYWFEVEDAPAIEACTKTLIRQYAYKKGKEVYITDLERLKRAIQECAGSWGVVNCSICENKTYNNRQNITYNAHYRELEHEPIQIDLSDFNIHHHPNTNIGYQNYMMKGGFLGEIKDNLDYNLLSYRRTDENREYLVYIGTKNKIEYIIKLFEKLLHCKNEFIRNSVCQPLEAVTTGDYGVLVVDYYLADGDVDEDDAIDMFKIHYPILTKELIKVFGKELVNNPSKSFSNCYVDDRLRAMISDPLKLFR